jgi:hypothetical protein
LPDFRLMSGLNCRNAAGTIDWLCRALGFELRL